MICKLYSDGKDDLVTAEATIDVCHVGKNGAAVLYASRTPSNISVRSVRMRSKGESWGTCNDRLCSLRAWWPVRDQDRECYGDGYKEATVRT